MASSVQGERESGDIIPLERVKQKQNEPTTREALKRTLHGGIDYTYMYSVCTSAAIVHTGRGREVAPTLEKKKKDFPRHPKKKRIEQSAIKNGHELGVSYV